jgi:hypothetical protein
MLKVVDRLKEDNRPERLEQKVLERDGAKYGVQSSRHTCGRHKVHWDFVPPPRKSLFAEPGALNFTGRTKFPNDDSGQEEVKVFSVSRRRGVLVGANIFVVPEGMLNVKVSVARRAHQESTEKALKPIRLVAELMSGDNANCSSVKASRQRKADKLESGHFCPWTARDKPGAHDKVGGDADRDQ